MKPTISVAIETSCRAGGLALGRDGELVRTVAFDAKGRHATALVQRLDELVRGEGLAPGDIGELYVSAGPGSFTGVRVGVTVARTLGQAVEGLRCVAVPTILAVARNAEGLDWRNLGVVMDAKEDLVYAGLFARERGRIVAAGAAAPVAAREFLDAAPRPLLLIGEALGFVKMEAPEVTAAESGLWLPTAEGVWRVGRELAASGQFTPYPQLLPIYPRKPEAVRLWDLRKG